MLAVLLLNRMTMKRRVIRKQRHKAKPIKEVKPLEVVYCRTCLSTEDLEPIFASKENAKKRSHELKLVTGLEIKMDDSLSQQICSKCIIAVKKALQFRRTSKKAEKELLSMNSPSKFKKKYKLQKKDIKTAKVKKVTTNKVEIEIDCDIYRDDYQIVDFGDDEGYHNDNGYQSEAFQNEQVTCDVVNQEENEIGQESQKADGRRKRGSIPNASLYKCSTCNKEFRMKATYKAHMRFHTNYCVCETCGKRCRNNNQLQEHKRARHGLGRIHKCAYCDYSSATKEALTIHERRHTGERPYVCDHCGATFHRRSNLVQHIAIHLPEKNFQCDLCPKRLKSRKFLQIHKHNAHTGKRYGYLCSVCEHRFEKPNKVRAHARRVHGLPDDQQGPIVRCTICNKREKSKKLLQVHSYKVHRSNRYKYLCPVCQDVFTRPGNVRQHLLRSHGVARDRQGAIDRFEVTDNDDEQKRIQNLAT